MSEELHVINDITGLNPVKVWAVVVPTSVEEVQETVRRTTAPISIGGGRFSMGGQVSSPESLHLDMRKMNGIVSFSPMKQTIRVQTGIRWCDIQKFLDPHNLSVKIMQTYANFTVGGSLSVNVHGRYVGLGPLILSVREIAVVLADGELVRASPAQNSELFYGCVGGYGGLGIIVEAELELAPNIRVERIAHKMSSKQYLEHFRASVRTSRRAVFHNADLYPPHYTTLRSITWVETDKPVTAPHRLRPIRKSYTIEKYLMWAFSETPFGKWRREFLIEPLMYLRSKVHWRNYEAGMNVAELEPVSRKHSTYVLQEYFVPYEKFEQFLEKMSEILQRHRVNMLNISVRHAMADPGSMLAWARHEVFAFVLYYKQRTRENAKERVAVWTRELIDAAISFDGAYYLPYQAHATPEQFHKAFPRARELFALKRRLDPQFRFRNIIWNSYYAPEVEPKERDVVPDSEFHAVYSEVKWRDKFYLFLQNIFHLFPEDRFHTLIKEGCSHYKTDEAIYRFLLEKLPEIKPPLAELFYALPALKKQKRELTRQTLELLGDRKTIRGYVEIGTTGRYVSELRKHVRFEGPTVLLHELDQTNSPADIMERGQLRRLGQFVPLQSYEPISPTDIADSSIDLVTCYVGLHHAEPQKLDGFIRSLWRVLRPGGLFILRDHDVPIREMHVFVSLVHTVFNAGLGESWDYDRAELRHFVSVEEWSRRLEARGLKDTKHRLRQANDPTDNLLMSFVKVEQGR